MELNNISVTYRSMRSGHSVKALQDVSFKLEPGDNLGVVGHNGSGKSTLLKVLAGVIKPDHGSVERHGASVSLLTLQAGFDPTLDAYDNMMLSGLLLGMSRKEIRQKTAAIAELSGLKDALERPVETYSAGMRSRLGFATAVQIDPDVLLIDEVLAVGDHEFRQQSEAILHERFSSNRSVIFVSHQLASVRRLCPRTIWLDGGQIKLDGETNPLLVKYVESHEAAQSAKSAK